MKKQKSTVKLFLGLILTIFAAAVLVLLHVALKLEIEKITKEKILLEEEINIGNNKTTMLQVEVQKLEARERITAIAEEKLGMVQNSGANTVIEIDKFQVDHVIKTVNSKYE